MCRLALVGGRILTMTGLDEIQEGPGPEAVLLEQGRIVAVGPKESVLGEIRAGDEVVNLEGRALLPGFIDAHLHPVSYGLAQTGINCLPPRVNSISDIKSQVCERVSSLPPGSWIVGWSYDDTRLAEERHPLRWDLDEVAPGNPVFLGRVCGHLGVANSRALQLARIDRDTPDPPGGTIDRDSQGIPTGVLRETAQDLVSALIPPLSREELKSTLTRVSEDLLSHGIIGACHAHLQSEEEGRVWEEMLQLGRFKPRMAFLVSYRLWRALQSSGRPPGRALDIAGVKFFGDGSISGRTAAMDEPFLGEEGTGLLVTSEADMHDLFHEVISDGGRVAVHAMGDRAIRLTLDALETSVLQGRLSVGEGRPNRIEHCSMPSLRDIQRMRFLGVVPVAQPIFMFAEGEAYLDNLGYQRARRAYPFRALLQEGVRPVLSSDAPATTWADATDVLLGVRAAVSRKTWAGRSLGEEEALTTIEALRGYTVDSAHALGWADELGTIEPGKKGDLVVLSSDPLGTPLEEIGVQATLLNGELVWGEV